MTIQQQRSAGEDDILTELTPDEYRAAVHRALDELGLTYDELRDQADRHYFTSGQAHDLWMMIGGTLDL